MLYTLKMDGMRFHAFHGSIEVDRELGQVVDVSIDLTYQVSLQDAEKPEKIFSYAVAYDVVQKVVMSTKFLTLEALALEIARKLFASCAAAEIVDVAIKRGQLYVPGVVSSAEVVISVTREDLEE